MLGISKFKECDRHIDLFVYYMLIFVNLRLKIICLKRELGWLKRCLTPDRIELLSSFTHSFYKSRQAAAITKWSTPSKNSNRSDRRPTPLTLYSLKLRKKQGEKFSVPLLVAALAGLDNSNTGKWNKFLMQLVRDKKED